MYQSDAPVKVLVAGDQFETVQVLEYASVSYTHLRAHET